MRWLLLATVATGCATATPGETPPPTYLALGDSVAFGFDPLVDLRQKDVSGYPELLAERTGLAITNLSCPGEASGGFTSKTGADNHCRENRAMYPLHADYEGTQLAAAVAYLGEHPETSLVTIDIGANDVFLLDHVCNRELTCILSGFVTLIADYNRNLDMIFERLRSRYDGPLVALTIYNPIPADSTAQYAIEQINSALATKVEHYGGIVADGMTTFAAAGKGDPCKAGLLIEMPDGTCDVHPTPAGAAVLAEAIAGVLPQ